MKSVVSLIAILGLALAAQAADKQPFNVAGIYTETCACSAPCKCELTGDVPPSCQGVGAFKISSGQFGGMDLAGVNIAFAGKPGEWIRVYIDAPDKDHRAAAEKLVRAAFAPWGKMEAIKDAKVEIAGTYGAYTISVDGGATMKYAMQPMLGGDGKTAVAHTNTFDPISPVFLQGKSTEDLTYHDGERAINLSKGRNAYFNDKLDTTGQL